MLPQERLKLLFAMLEEDPADAFTMYAIGMEYLGTGDKAAALPWFEKTLKEHPDYVAVYYQLGKLLELNTPDKSKAIYQMGIAKAVEQKKHHDANELKQALNAILDDEE